MTNADARKLTDIGRDMHEVLARQKAENRHHFLEGPRGTDVERNGCCCSGHARDLLVRHRAPRGGHMFDRAQWEGHQNVHETIAPRTRSRDDAHRMRGDVNLSLRAHGGAACFSILGCACRAAPFCHDLTVTKINQYKNVITATLASPKVKMIQFQHSDNTVFFLKKTNNP